MPSQHLIGRCSWQTELDQQSHAVDLQNFISEWSNSVLIKELESYFDQICPATQTWHIDQLQLDLGEIAFDVLAEELPRRLRACLRTAFARLQLTMVTTDTRSANGVLVDEEDAAALQQIAIPHATEDIIRWFLMHGCAPWWHRGTEGVAQLWEKQLVEATQEGVQMIRQLCQQEIVCQRIVWQFGEERVRRLVQLLEPWKGDHVCAFADALFLAHAQRKMATLNAREFKNRAWITILNYLVVDRGTLFNTHAFVRAILQRIARQYQLTFNELLQQMHVALQALAPSGLIKDPLSLAIDAMYQQGQLGGQMPPTAAPPDHWVMMQSMLRQPDARVQVGNEFLTFNEVFNALATEDPQRMAQLLRREGHSENVRHGVVRLFSERELAVRVLAPQEHEFILAHAAHTTQALMQHGQVRSEKIVWQIVLTYLLAQTMASFQLRQLVSHTLEQVCQRHGIPMLVMLDLLIFTATLPHSFPHRFQLLQICQELKAFREKRLVTGNETATAVKSHRETILHYLLNGHEAGKTGLPAQAIVREMLVTGSVTELQALIAEAQAKTQSQNQALRSNDAALYLRLLQLAGPGNLATVFELLQPNSSEFCLSLLATWLQWQQQAALPSLARLDLALHLPGLMLQALPGFADGRLGSSPRHFDVTYFWHCLTLLLQKAGVDLPALAEQLQSCMQEQPLDNRPLSEAQGRAALRPVTATMVAAQSDRLSRLWQRWAATLSSPSRPLSAPISLITQQFAQLLAAADMAALTRWLDCQPREDVVRRWLPALMRHHQWLEVKCCLYQELPAAFGAQENAPDPLLQQLSALFRHCGYWHGTRAVLEQQLQRVFYTVLWDARKRKLSPAELLAKMLGNACLRLNIRLSDCLSSFTGQHTLLKNTPWQEAVVFWRREQSAQALDAVPQTSVETAADAVKTLPPPVSSAQQRFTQDHLGHYLQDPRLPSIARHLLLHGRAPTGLPVQGGLDLTRLLFDLGTQQPALLRALLQPLGSTPEALFRLQQSMPLAWLLEAMQASAPPHAGTIRLIANLHHCLEQMQLARIPRQQLSSILFVLVLHCWLAHDWAALDIRHLVTELALQLLQQFQLPPVALQQAFAPLLAGQPAALQRAVRQAVQEPALDVPSARVAIHSPSQSLEKKIKQILSPVAIPRDTGPMMINNAGLVILHGFFEPLFSRLGLMEKGRFLDEQAQRRAVHYLQFLVTGHRQTPEHYLVFNKVLCGLPLHTPLELEIEMTDSELSLCESMLHSVIKYWSAIGSSSLDGFRGNWLVRNGSLKENGDHWQLTVEKRAYDILLKHAPFSYSMIRLQWMEKAVQVTWPT